MLFSLAVLFKVTETEYVMTVTRKFTENTIGRKYPATFENIRAAKSG
jgi:hypothetical protein